MLRPIWQSQSLLELDNLANLEDLRNQLAQRLAVLLVGSSGLAMWLSLPHNPFPVTAFVLFGGLLGLGIGVLSLAENHPRPARYLLGWGLTAGLLLSMALFAEPWLPLTGLLLIFVQTMLLSGSELVSAALIVLWAGWLTWQGQRLYPLPGLAAIFTLGVAVAWLAVSTLYTALQWTRNMQQRADHLLDEVRDHRAELGRALKSSEIANSLLRRTQRELIVARQQADEARRLKEQFAANISHELRTPLNLILGFSHMMYLSPEVYGNINWSSTLRGDVYQIYRSSRHLVDMIDDILDLSRFEMAQFSLHKETTPLGPLLEEAGGIAADLFRGQPVQFQIEIPPDLPVLAVDRTRIRQVLLNLLNNARRFTEQGLVRLTAHQNGREITVSVSDTGPGIAADKLAHIFDEFYQVDLSLRRSHQGAGLGLAISKRFIQLHGGSIWAESEIGRGSTFFFTLPVQPQPQSPLGPAGSGSAADYWPEERAPVVLVVDPDPNVTALLNRRIDQFELIQVAEPAQLAEAVAFYHPHAVIHNLPPGQSRQGDEPEAVPTPLIACSLPSQAWITAELAVAACLTKPILAPQLLTEIARVGYVEKVLIVDDDRGFAQLVQRMLEANGREFKIRRAYDGNEGVQAMQRDKPDLILLDLIMPGMDGFEVLQYMRQSPELNAIPIILLTATSFAEDALAQGSSQIVISRSDGLRPTEAIACLQAVLNVVEPTYDESLIPAENSIMLQTALETDDREAASDHA